MITSYPEGEDWGWFIEYIDGATEIMIGIGSEAKEGDGYNGRPIKWQVFVRQQQSLNERLKRTPVSPQVEQLATAVERVLKASGITVARTEA